MTFKLRTFGGGVESVTWPTSPTGSRPPYNLTIRGVMKTVRRLLRDGGIAGMTGRVINTLGHSVRTSKYYTMGG